MQYHLIILILIYLFIPSSVWAADKKQALSSIYERCEKARSLSQYDSLEVYSIRLISEAKQERNQRLETYGYFYNGLAKLFNGKAEESQKIHDKAEELARKTDNDSVLALVMNARGIYHALMQNNNFVAQQFFFKSLELAHNAGYEDLCHRVRGNLLTLSHSMDDSVSSEIAKEVYDYGVKTNNNEQISMGAYYIATYHYTHERYDEAEKYLQKAIDTYKKYPYEDIASVYLLYTKIFISKNELDEAEKTVKKSLELAEKYHQLSMVAEAYITFAEVRSKQKSHEDAISIAKKALEVVKEAGMTSKMIDCNQLMAENYIAMNDVNDALSCLQSANKLLKEQATINMERLSHEQRIMRDIEQKEMEAKIKQEQITAQRFIMILLAAVVIVLCVLLIVIYVNYRRRQTLYKSIVQQNSRSIARQTELQQQIEYLYAEKEKWSKMMEKENVPVADAEKEAASADIDAEEQSALNSEFGMKKDKIDNLYTELCRLMETEQLYREAQLTREKMADRLGTNRTYLVKVIKEKTNMNYLQFVNSYRINEAIKILSDKDKINYPLKQIWSDLGFNSPSTFFKLFQQTVGITPSTYRKQFLEVKDENENEDESEDEK